MNKTIIYEDEDFKFLYTIEQDYLVLHCYVFNWNKSVLKKGIKVFAEFLNNNRGKKIISVTQNPKFCELLGGEYLSTVEDYEVYKWESTQ